MNNNREILNALAPAKSTDWKLKLEERKKNRAWMRKSMDIALDILDAIKEKGMTQKELAQILRITPQTVSKTLSGKENLSLETITRYEEALNISLIHTGFQKEEKTTVETRYVYIPFAFFIPERVQHKQRKLEYKEIGYSSLLTWN